MTMFKISIPVSIFKEKKVYIAYTPILDLSTSGKTYEEVQKRFTEVVRIFIEELVDMDTLDEVLANLGWKKVKSTWSPPIPISNEVTQINIPLN